MYRRIEADESESLREMIRQNPGVLILTVLFGMLAMFALLLWLDM